MSQKAFSMIWTLLGGFLLLYIANVWASTTGAGAWSTFPLLDGRPNVSAYHGIIVGGVLLALLCGVGILHARRSNVSGLARLPTVSLGDESGFDPSRWSFKIWQLLFLFLFILVPAAGILHFHEKIRGDAIVWNDSWPAQTSMKVVGVFAALRTDVRKRPKAWPESFVCTDLTKLETAQAQTRTMWLADRACDLHKWQQVGPFASPKDSNVVNWPLEDQAMPRTQCVQDVVAVDDRKCLGPNDLSPPCEKELRACRGVEWLPTGSPVLLAFATALGWGMVILLGVAVFSRVLDPVQPESSP